MTARVQRNTPKTELTLSAGEEVPWRDARTDALEARRAALLDGARPWGHPYTNLRDLPPVAPRHIDWYRVAALIIVAASAVLTFLGLYLILVYVLTAF